MSLKPVLYLPMIALLLTATRGNSQKQDAVIRLVQDQANVLNDFESVVKLKKKQFKFQVMLQHCDGVFVFASVGDSVYHFSETSPIRDFSYLKLLELRDEDIFNTNRELNISETGWSYWFYNPTAEWYPFNRKVTYIDTDRVICTKNIKQLYNVADGTTVRLKDVTKPLYIFFIAVASYDENGRPSKELLRRKVKIEWEGDGDDDD